MSDRESRRLRRRARIWAERILENSQLRDNLEDDQAKRLLKWAITRLEQTAGRAMMLPDADMEPMMDSLTDDLSRVMRQVNGLVPALPVLVEDDLAEDLLIDFGGSVQEITNRPLPDDWIDNLLAGRYRMNGSEVFEYLFAGMTGGTDGQETE